MFDGVVGYEVVYVIQVVIVLVVVLVVVEVCVVDFVCDQGCKEVVFVDILVVGYKQLEVGIGVGVGIVEFDGSCDGLVQIVQWVVV